MKFGDRVDQGLGDDGGRLHRGVGHRQHARRVVGRDEAARDLRRPAVRTWSSASSAATTSRAADVSRTPAVAGYAKGVPMGGDLPPAPAGQGADLPGGRAEGPADAATSTASRSSRAGSTRPASRRRRSTTWSGATPQRRKIVNGKLTPVGNTVDVARATWTNTHRRSGTDHRVEGPGLRSVGPRLLLRCACWRSPRRAGPPTTPRTSR